MPNVTVEWSLVLPSSSSTLRMEMSLTTGAEIQVMMSRTAAEKSRKVPMWWKKPVCAMAAGGGGGGGETRSQVKPGGGGLDSDSDSDWGWVSSVVS